MAKKMSSFRLSEETDEILKELQEKINKEHNVDISKAGVIQLALKRYSDLLFLDDEKKD